MLESEVFSRESTGEKEISPRAYNALIGACLAWGFAINWWLVVNVATESLFAINPWVFVIGYFASCYLGVFLFNFSDKPIVSFIGYNLVVVPFGLVVNLVVSRYDSSIVLEAIRLTAAVTVTMMILGVLYPKFFQKIYGAVTVALFILIITELFQLFILGVDHDWMDWAVAGCFCVYIGYDWGRANRIPKTVDNAIDSAAALYMDIINLFVRILKILGRR